MSARAVVNRSFPADAAPGRATVVFTREGGLTADDEAFIAKLPELATGAGAPEGLRSAVLRVVTAAGNPELASMYRSPDGALEIAQVDLNTVAFQTNANIAIDLLREQLTAGKPDGLQANVTGSAGIGNDYLEAIQQATDRTTIVTIVLVIVILLLIYRAPLAALAPLVTIGCAFLVSRGLLGILANAGWQIPTLLDSFIVVLVFGAGTDYTIFLISRFREELGHEAWPEAAQESVARIGAVITASAATVIVGLSSMAVGRFGMIQITGPALALAVFVTLLAGLTLTPAFLGIFGHYLFWPLHERRGTGDTERGFWATLARTITRRPGIVTLLVGSALLIPLLSLPALKQNFDVLSELPEGADSRAGFEQVSKHYDKGQLLPINVLVEVPGSDLSAPDSLALVRATEDRLAAVPGVKSVRSIIAPSGDGVTPDAFRPSVQVATLAKSIVPSGDPQAALQKLLQPDATAGIDSASAYLAALAGAYPGLADVASYKSSQGDLTAFKTAIEQMRGGLRVSTQLTALADALTNPASAGGDAAQLGTALSGYLQELAKAYPDVVGQPGFQGAVAALQGLQQKLDLALVAQLSASLRDLAGTFTDRPDAYLISSSLPSTPESTAAQQEMADLTSRLPGELMSLADEFATRSDFFLPAGMSGEAGTQVAQAMSAYFSEPRDVTRLYVILADDPYSTTAFSTAQSLRTAMAGDAATYGAAAHVYVGGPTAEFLDVQTTISEDFLRVAIITVIGVFIVLVLLLRALIAPIYLVLTVLLSFGASMGLSTMIFQNYLGHAGVNYFVPLLVFVLLVALGSDYNIFLMSRVREESDKRGVKDGIRFASARTGTVITSAGIILAGTFAALMTAQVQILFQVGFAVALGVLIDTFVVRSLLVPAITALVGDFAWWPVGRRPHAPSPPAATAAEPPVPPPSQG